MFDWLYEWLEEFTDWLYSLFQSVVTWFLDIVYYVFDSCMSLFESLILSIPVPVEWSTADPWSGLPAQTYYILDKFNIGTVLVILLAAWTVRFTLNLIPAAFTRV